MIRRILAAVLACVAFSTAHSASEGIPWDKFPIERTTEMTALQNGAKLFVNYCLNCHSAAFMRFNRMRDLGLTEDQIKAKLIFTGAKVGDTMKVSLDPKDAKDWFGGVPPDLTLIARSRGDASKGSGADYLYTFLRNFYRDDTKATGWNNLAFPNVGMPHVLWELQGQQRPVYAEAQHAETGLAHHVKGLKLESPGTMSPDDYSRAVADLVAFLQWMGEPNQNARIRIGVWVLVFLGLFTVIAWRLNAAYWKDVK